MRLGGGKGAESRLPKAKKGKPLPGQPPMLAGRPRLGGPPAPGYGGRPAPPGPGYGGRPEGGYGGDRRSMGSGYGDRRDSRFALLTCRSASNEILLNPAACAMQNAQHSLALLLRAQLHVPCNMAAFTVCAMSAETALACITVM
jgi:hypothetical protein